MVRMAGGRRTQGHFNGDHLRAGSRQATRAAAVGVTERVV
jgi:hypothetical protein